MAGALREIIASFGIEFDQKGVKQGEGALNGMIDKVMKFGPAVAGAFVVKEILGFAGGILDSADALGKTSQALSVNAADLQGWQWAAKLSGSSAEEFTGAFTKFNRNVAEASKGSGPAADAFKALGIDIKDATGKVGEPIELMDGVADAIAGMQDPAKRTAAVMALFGKGAVKLVPLLQEGSEGIKEMRDELAELGGIYDDDFMDQAEAINDNVDRLKMGFQGLAIQGLKFVLPYVERFTIGAVKLIKQIIPIIKNSQAIKAALIVLGVAGATALAPLLFSIMPIVAAFLLLEDALGFMSGNDSLIGRWVDKSFGKGSQEKLREFLSTLADSGIKDALMLFKGLFAIFTDDQPLDKKFQDLLIFIEGPLKTQLTKDFGAIGFAIAEMGHALTIVLDIMHDMITAAAAISKFAGATIGSALFESDDAAANKQAKEDAAARAAGSHTATAADLQARHDAQPWYARAAQRVLVGEFDPSAMVPQASAATQAAVATQTAQTAQTATAPVNAYLSPPIQQDNKTNITQNFYATTPEAVQQAAASGASAGVDKSQTDGVASLIATQAAVRKQGG